MERPDYWKSTLKEIDETVKSIKKGTNNAVRSFSFFIRSRAATSGGNQ